jgi:hypothetical protein
MEGFILSVNNPVRKLAKRLDFQETASGEEPVRV